jgi:hypothetical protein
MVALMSSSFLAAFLAPPLLEFPEDSLGFGFLTGKHLNGIQKNSRMILAEICWNTMVFLTNGR